MCGVSIWAGVGLGTPFAWVEAYFAIFAPKEGRRMCDTGFALGRSRPLGPLEASRATVPIWLWVLLEELRPVGGQRPFLVTFFVLRWQSSCFGGHIQRVLLVGLQMA